MAESVWTAKIDVPGDSMLENGLRVNAFQPYSHIADLLKNMPAAQNQAQGNAGNKFQQILQNGNPFGLDDSIARPLDNALVQDPKLQGKILKLWNEHPDKLDAALPAIGKDPANAVAIVDGAYNNAAAPAAPVKQATQNNAPAKPANTAPANASANAQQPPATLPNQQTPTDNSNAGLSGAAADAASAAVPGMAALGGAGMEQKIGNMIQAIMNLLKMLPVLLPALLGALGGAFKGGGLNSFKSLFDGSNKDMNAAMQNVSALFNLGAGQPNSAPAASAPANSALSNKASNTPEAANPAAPAASTVASDKTAEAGPTQAANPNRRSLNALSQTNTAGQQQEASKALAAAPQLAHVTMPMPQTSAAPKPAATQTAQNKATSAAPAKTPNFATPG